MAQQIQPDTKKTGNYFDINLTPTTGGVILDEAAAYNVAPPNSLSYAENLNNDILGYMTSRTPLVDFPDSYTNGGVPNSVTVFEPSGGGDSYLFWQEGSDKVTRTKALVGGVLATQTGVVSGSKARFEAYRDKLFVVSTGGGVRSADSATLNFTAVAGVGGIPNPSPNLLSLGFYGMGWFANNTDTTCQLYNTDPIPSDPALMTWSSTSVNGAGSVMLPANNNQTITALVPTQQALYVFFQNQILRVFSPNNVDTTPIAYIGTPSQESVVRGKDGFYFYHATGIYKLEQSTSNGIAQPVDISAPIRPILRRISSISRTAVTSWADDDNVYFNIGRVKYLNETLDKTYILRYTISTKLWTLYTTLNRSITCSTSHNFKEATSGTFSPIAFLGGQDTGTSSGNFMSQFNNVDFSTINSTADDGMTLIGSTTRKEPILVDYITHWQDFGMLNYIKGAAGVSVYSENGVGLTLMCQVDKDGQKTSEWRTIGTLTENFVSMFSQFQEQEFNRIRFRVTGNGKGVRIKIGQPTIEMLDVRGKKKQ